MLGPVVFSSCGLKWRVVLTVSEFTVCRPLIKLVEVQSCPYFLGTVNPRNSPKDLKNVLSLAVVRVNRAIHATESNGIHGWG